MSAAAGFQQAAIGEFQRISILKIRMDYYNAGLDFLPIITARLPT